MGKITRSIATLGMCGYAKAPGTLGSLLALPGAYLLSYVPFPYNYIILFGVYILGLYAIDKALPYFDDSDPSQIIFDEYIGMLVTLIGIVYNPLLFTVGFILFRIFDIYKPLAIRLIEKLPGAYGIVWDDVLAGIYAQILLRIFFI